MFIETRFCFLFTITKKRQLLKLDPDPEKSTPRKIYTLKNLDTEKARPEKAGPFETWTLKNIVQFINTEWRDL